MDDDLPDESAYERYLGRWSRVVADEFLAWLSVPPKSVWLDVACGTGAVTRAILAACDPLRVDACDLSSTRLEYARRSIADPRVRFNQADASALADAAGGYDAVVSGLPFPTISDPPGVLSKFALSAKAGGVVGIYVWDLYGEMQLLRHFWEASTALDSDADEVDTGDQFAICKSDRLANAFRDVGMREVEVRPFDASARFCDFDDYWEPFTKGSAPAQAHVQSLSAERRVALRERLRASLPIAGDGSLALIARAWAAKGYA